RPAAAHVRTGGHLRQRRQRPEHELARRAELLDAVEPGDAVQVDHALGLVEPLLHAIDEIDAAGLDHDAVMELRDGIVEALRLHPLERFHLRASFPSSLPSAASTTAGFIGSVRMRTPMAL